MNFVVFFFKEEKKKNIKNLQHISDTASDALPSSAEYEAFR
jgi:hypothetical protein